MSLLQILFFSTDETVSHFSQRTHTLYYMPACTKSVVRAVKWSFDQKKEEAVVKYWSKYCVCKICVWNFNVMSLKKRNEVLEHYVLLATMKRGEDTRKSNHPVFLLLHNNSNVCSDFFYGKRILFPICFASLSTETTEDELFSSNNRMKDRCCFL